MRRRGNETFGRNMVVGSREGPYEGSSNGNRATRGAVRPDDPLHLLTIFVMARRKNGGILGWGRIIGSLEAP